MKFTRSLCIILALTPLAGSAEIYPLSENTWSNPDFVARFMGTYGMDTERTPSITSEEKIVFEAIAPLIATQPAEAIASLQAALTPESSAALIYTLANLKFQSSDLPGAEKAYTDAIKKFPNFLRAYRNLGIVYVQQSKFAQATPMLLKSIELGGQGADLYGMLAYSYLSLGNTEAALRSYEQALFFQPDGRDWRMGKVQCLVNLGRQDEAIQMIDDLIQEFPTQTDLLLLQSNAYIAKNDPASAAATLEILRASGGGNTNATVLLGDIYLNFNQPDLALELYREAAAKADLTADRALRIARRLANIASWKELDVFFADIDAKAPGKFGPTHKLEVLNIKAQSDLAQNRTDAAAIKLADVVEADPLNGKALLLLADYYWKKDDVARAELYFERAARVEAVAPEALIQNARMLVSLREYDKAVLLLERAQLLDPRAYIAQYLEKVSGAALASR